MNLPLACASAFSLFNPDFLHFRNEPERCSCSSLSKKKLQQEGSPHTHTTAQNLHISTSRWSWLFFCDNPNCFNNPQRGFTSLNYSPSDSSASSGGHPTGIQVAPILPASTTFLTPPPPLNKPCPCTAVSSLPTKSNLPWHGDTPKMAIWA